MDRRRLLAWMWMGLPYEGRSRVKSADRDCGEHKHQIDCILRRRLTWSKVDLKRYLWSVEEIADTFSLRKGQA